MAHSPHTGLPAHPHFKVMWAPKIGLYLPQKNIRAKLDALSGTQLSTVFFFWPVCTTLLYLILAHLNLPYLILYLPFHNFPHHFHQPPTPQEAVRLLSSYLAVSMKLLNWSGGHYLTQEILVTDFRKYILYLVTKLTCRKFGCFARSRSLSALFVYPSGQSNYCYSYVRNWGF